MANNLDRPERRIQDGSLSLNMRPFSFNFSAQYSRAGVAHNIFIYWDFLFLVGFLSEDSKFIFGGKERNVLFKKNTPAVQ